MVRVGRDIEVNGGAHLTGGLVGSAGLLLDVCGAFFLAESFVLKNRAEVVRETGSYWDGNPYQLRSAVRQTLEARVGFAFLFVGFFGQFLTYSGWLTPGVNKWPVQTLFGGLAVFGLAFLIVRKVALRLTRRTMARE